MTGVDERAGAAAVRPVNMRHWPGDPGRPALALHCMMGSASYWGPIADRLGVHEAREPDLAEALVAAAVQAVDVPVTVKMRLGWDDASRNAP